MSAARRPPPAGDERSRDAAAPRQSDPSFPLPVGEGQGEGVPGSAAVPQGDGASDHRRSAVSPFLSACRRQPVEHTPVWFMRQAGRSLPEYRRVRERYSFMEISRQPELAAEVTLQPVRRLGVDAAILFADIMTPLVGIGVDLELKESVGPVIAHPIRELRDLEVLRPIQPEQDVPYILEAIRLTRRELGNTPLIGFAGAPFTLASYLVEGRPSRTYHVTKALMYRAPEVWHALMQRLADIIASYMHAKLDAGVDALQLFDSWVGCLSPRDYETFVRPYTRQIFASLRPRGVPLIHFGTDTATLLDQMKDDGASVVGVDWRIELDTAWQRLGPDLAIQGNLDPAALLGPWEVLADYATAVLRRAAGRPGHVFNLGHGIDPNTPVDNLARLVEFVHQFPLTPRPLPAGEGARSSPLPLGEGRGEGVSRAGAVPQAEGVSPARAVPQGEGAAVQPNPTRPAP